MTDHQLLYLIGFLLSVIVYGAGAILARLRQIHKTLMVIEGIEQDAWYHRNADRLSQ